MSLLTYWPVYPPHIPPLPWQGGPVYERIHDVGRIVVYIVKAIFENPLIP